MAGIQSHDPLLDRRHRLGACRPGVSETAVIFKGQRVAVIGAGRSGVAAAKLLARQGARVLISDSSPTLPKSPQPPFAKGGRGGISIEIETGGHSDRVLES